MKQLRWTLRLNVATCAVFGAVFIYDPLAVSAYLGALPRVPLQLLGTALLIHSAHLLIGSLRKNLLPWEIYYFSAGDILWFLGSLTLLVSTDYISTRVGVSATLLVACLVAGIGLFQLWYLAESRDAAGSTQIAGDHLPVHLSRIEAIRNSWLGIKTWIKIWLVGLNLVFLISIYFWPTMFTQVVLVAYLATAPLLLVFMILQRGLTRLLGVAHLIPWVPLITYITLRLSGGAAGPQLTFREDSSLFVYAIVLVTFLAICLAFDLVDLVRWIKGDKARLGSPTNLLSRSNHQDSA